MSGSKYALLIFDFDGTLVDTAPDIADSANAVLKAMSLPPKTLADAEHAIGRGVHDLMTKLMPASAADRIEEAVTRFRAHYAEHLVVRSKPYPGTRESLEKDLSGIAKAVVTNKPHLLAMRVLEILKMDHLFSPVIGTGGDFPAKPDPSAVEHVIRKAGCTPSQTLFIGDSPIDAETAKRAGADFGWVNYGYERCKEFRFEFSNPKEWRRVIDGTI